MRNRVVRQILREASPSEKKYILQYFSVYYRRNHPGDPENEFLNILDSIPFSENLFETLLNTLLLTPVNDRIPAQLHFLGSCLSEREENIDYFLQKAEGLLTGEDGTLFGSNFPLDVPRTVFLINLLLGVGFPTSFIDCRDINPSNLRFYGLLMPDKFILLFKKIIEVYSVKECWPSVRESLLRCGRLRLNRYQNILALNPLLPEGLLRRRAFFTEEQALEVEMLLFDIELFH
jgi:hypothetical protein